MPMALWWSAVRSTTLRMVRLLDASREESRRQVSEIARTIDVLTEQQDLLEQLLEEQAALRRLATLVAKGVAPSEILARAAEEIARIFRIDVGLVIRFDADATTTVVAAFGTASVRRVDDGVAAVVRRTGRPARIGDDAVGAPIVIGDRLWGVAVAMGQPPARTGLPADAEQRLAHLADLIATAVLNADARAQLTASRARVVTAADDARRTLERELHDGIQHKLVSLALVLRTAAAAAPPALPELRSQLSEVEVSLAGIIDELREMTRGIHPAVLSEGGLQAALKVLARRSAVPVELGVRIDRRVPERVEVAAYYVVSEALVNAGQANASVVRVDADASDGFLRISVEHDGVGGAGLERESGLITLEDRVAAVGGEIRMTTPPQRGTSIQVALPILEGPGQLRP
jgi:signal transduction histidine kinase